MFSTALVVAVISLYMAFLFAVAELVEKRAGSRTRFTPYIYALAITVYFTSWGFYGNVGFASQSGFLYLATDIGSFLAILAWWKFLRYMVRVKESYHITNIADFISARYNRSQSVAALVTLIGLFGVMPYIALQLKSIVDTIGVISPLSERDWGGTGLLVTLVMVAFTVLFGARRLDPTERHQGVMAVLAVQGIVKIVAMVAIGLFATYGLYKGFGPLFQQADAAGLHRLTGSSVPQGSITVHWITLILLGMVAIQCLPRQFHIAVVENSNERDILKAMWLVPAYLVLFDLFVVPIAAAGLLQGLPPAQADEFVLRLPYTAGAEWLALFTFVGGFSAASGMVIISTMSLSTMATNHLLLPVIEEVRACNFLRHYLLPLRWVMILLIILCSYGIAWAFSNTYMLAAMGTIAFVGVAQIAPVMFGGMIWRGGNRFGAVAGLLAGFVIWCYTLVIPAFSRHGWIDTSLLINGPWHIDWLKPEALLGVNMLSPVSHSVLWSLTFNIVFFIFGSWVYRPSKEERAQLGEFISALSSGSRIHKGRPTGLEAYIQFGPKCKEAIRLLSQYLPERKAERDVAQIIELLQAHEKHDVTIIELVEFHRMLETTLAGSIGAASAHRVIESGIGYSEREKRDLKAIYSHIVSELRAGPAIQVEVVEKKPAEDMRYSFVEELQETIEQQKKDIAEQKSALARLKKKLERKDRELFEQRIVNQKLSQEVRELHKQIESHLPT